MTTLATVALFLAVKGRAAVADSMEREVAALLAATPGLHARMPEAEQIRARVRGTDERYYTFDENDSFEGIGRPSYYVAGTIATGQRVILVPIYTGGTQGIRFALVYATVRGKMTFIGYIPSPGHMWPRITGGFIVIGTDAYVKGDNAAFCCPWHERFDYDTLDGAKLFTVRSEVVKTKAYR